MGAAWTRVRRRTVEWSADHPWTVLAAILLLTLAFGSQLPRIRTDTDPKNMLPITSPVRQYNDQVEGWFGLHPDVLVVGIWSDKRIFTPENIEGNMNGIRRRSPLPRLPSP